MGFFDFSHKLRGSDAVTLTAAGKDKASSGEGGQYSILSALKDAHGTATINEIAQEAHIPPEMAARLVSTLIRAKYVQQTRGGMG